MRREGEEPEESQENGDTGDDLGVDLTTQFPGGGVGLVKVLAVDTGDDGGEDELRGPKDDADNAFDGHCEGLVLL